MRIVEAFTVRLPERHSQDKKVQLENGKKTLGGERERKKNVSKFLQCHIISFDMLLKLAIKLHCGDLTIKNK
jgi:hypothetical protein